MPSFYWSTGSSTSQDPTKTTGYTSSNQRSSVSLPQTRSAFRLGDSSFTKPIEITKVGSYLAGYGASRTVSLVVDDAVTSSFSVPSVATTLVEPRAAYTNKKTISKKITDTTGGPQLSMGFNTNGTTFFGRVQNVTGKTISPWNAESNVILWGVCDYIQVPTGPRNVSASALSQTSIRASWEVPSDDGSSPITGYVAQISASSSFSSVIQQASVDGNTFSYDFSTGLSAGTTYYVRIFAKNSLSSMSQNPVSIASQVASAATQSAPTGGGGTTLNLGKRADGTSLTIGKRFDGTNWVDITIAKRFDGSNWVDISN